MNVLGVPHSNFMWFLARMCLVLFLESGKNLNPKGHHLLAQNPKIPRSTSFGHVLFMVEILKFWVWNFFHECMSLKPCCCTSLGNFRSI